VLQAAPTLPGASWNAVDQAPQIIDDRYTVTTNLTGDGGFFRLMHP
jgi:hypothetical protein